MAKAIKTVFKDAVFTPSSGASDLELEGGSTPVKGDLEINGHKAIIGTGVHPDIQDPS